MERETGIEPALVAWKATVLPLNYSRAVLRFEASSAGASGWWFESTSLDALHFLKLVEGGGFEPPKA